MTSDMLPPGSISWVCTLAEPVAAGEGIADQNKLKNPSLHRNRDSIKLRCRRQLDGGEQGSPLLVPLPEGMRDSIRLRSIGGPDQSTSIRILS